MTMTDPTEKMVDDLLGRASAQDANPSGDLVARVLGDAAAVQDMANTTPTARNGMWAGLMEVLGGWPAVSSLAAATVAGIWIGVAPPAPFADVSAALLGDEVSVSFVSEDALLVFEGLIDG